MAPVSAGSAERPRPARTRPAGHCGLPGADQGREHLQRPEPGHHHHTHHPRHARHCRVLRVRPQEPPQRAAHRDHRRGQPRAQVGVSGGPMSRCPWGARALPEMKAEPLSTLEGCWLLPMVPSAGSRGRAGDSAGRASLPQSRVPLPCSVTWDHLRAVSPHLLASVRTVSEPIFSCLLASSGIVGSGGTSRTRLS